MNPVIIPLTFDQANDLLYCGGMAKFIHQALDLNKFDINKFMLPVFVDHKDFDLFKVGRSENQRITLYRVNDMLISLFAGQVSEKIIERWQNDDLNAPFGKYTTEERARLETEYRTRNKDLFKRFAEAMKKLALECVSGNKKLYLIDYWPQEKEA